MLNGFDLWFKLKFLMYHKFGNEENHTHVPKLTKNSKFKFTAKP